MRAFYCFTTEPEVVLAARRRPSADMTLPFESQTPIMFRRSIEIFRLSLTVQKLFACIDFAGYLASQFQKFGFWGFRPPNVIPYQCDHQ
jgi:hypothetical protein